MSGVQVIMSRDSAQSKVIEATPSARKLRARRQFEPLALRVSDGLDYGLHETLLPNITLAHAREALKAIPQSLSRSIIEERQIS